MICHQRLYRLPTTKRETTRIKQRMHLVSNILFVIENCTMILIFYRFSTFSNTWYSLPVTVCVCSFSVIGAVARVAHVCFVTKESIRKEYNPKSMLTQPKLVMSQAGESTKGVSRFDMMESTYTVYVSTV